jgi:hypothetical protein
VPVARIGALARRAQPSIPPVLEHGDIVLDTAERCAHRAGRPLALRPKEFGVLELLLAARGRAVSAEELLERVWDENADPFTATVKITVSRLRAKLGDPPGDPDRRQSRLPDMSGAARLNQRLTQLGFGHRLRRRTVRVRLTLLYGGLFLLSGAALVAITYGLFERATEYTRPRLPQIPHTPAIRNLRLPSPAQALTPLAGAWPALKHVQDQLAQDQYLLARSLPNRGYPPAAGRALPPTVVPLAQEQRQLVQGQHQLAQAVNQLAKAVHQTARAGSVEAAQRASDSHQLLVNSGIALEEP